jgi:hypothetical protein
MNTTSPTLLMGGEEKLRTTEGKRTTQGHMTSQKQSWDLDPGQCPWPAIFPRQHTNGKRRRPTKHGTSPKAGPSPGAPLALLTTSPPALYPPISCLEKQHPWTPLQVQPVRSGWGQSWDHRNGGLRRNEPEHCLGEVWSPQQPHEDGDLTKLGKLRHP